MTSAYVSLVQFTEEKGTDSLSSKAFEVESKFLGSKSQHKLKLHEPATLLVDVTTKEDASFVMVEIPIPAGCDFLDKTEAHNPHESQREYFKDKVAIFCTKLPKGQHSFKVQLSPNFAGKFIDGFALIGQTCSEFVQMGFAQIMRPPTDGIVNFQGDVKLVFALQQRHFLHTEEGVTLKNLDQSLVFHQRFYLAARGKFRFFITQTILLKIHIGQTRLVPAHQPNGAVNAAGNQAWPPIPTKMVAGFAQKNAHFFIAQPPTFGLIVGGGQAVFVFAQGL